jgi:hypothetical protein
MKPHHRLVVAGCLLQASLACSHAPAVTTPNAPAPAPKAEPAPKLAPAPDPCAPEAGPATQALQAFRVELLTAAAADPQAFQRSAQDRVTAFQRQNRTLLLAHADWSLRRMPGLTIPDLETLPDDLRVSTEVTDRMRSIVRAPTDPEAGPLQMYLDSVAVDPVRAFAAIRGAVLSAAGGPSNLERIYENVLESLAPPRIVRLNDDLAHPVLGMPKGNSVFAVWLDRDEARGVFTPKRIRWVSRKPSTEPSIEAHTADDALAAFANAVDALKPEEGDTIANISTRALDRVTGLAKQWLEPHAELLRERGACECKKLPRATLPELSDWKEEELPPSLLRLPARFPRLRWDALQAFLFLRTTIDARTMAVGDYSGQALIDGMVPPPVARANDDLKEPTLFLIESGTAVVVDFSSTPTRGFFPTNIRHYRKQ